LLLTGCENAYHSTYPATSENTQTAGTTISTTFTELQTTKITLQLPRYVDGSIKLLPQDELEGFREYEMSYRYIYYVVDGFYTDLVPLDEFHELMKSYEGSDHENHEMLLAVTLKHFNVTREKFDEATEKYIAAKQSLGFDITDERYEIPNGDIIYTFDNDIINEYYRRA
jgi:hypothetical protein